jgi:serine/threonine protein kinase
MAEAEMLRYQARDDLPIGVQSCHNHVALLGDSDGDRIGGAPGPDSVSGAYRRMTVSPDDRTQVISADSRSAGTMALVLPDSAGSTSDGEVEDNTELPVGTRLFEFEVTGLIGIGGFGIVYAAYDQFLHRAVAIKEYMPGSLATRNRDYTVVVRSQRHAETFEVGRRSFVNEARLLAQFDHPSLVKVFRFWEANGTAYMVMPLYKGVTLKQRLKEMGAPPSEAWLVSLLRQLIDALAVIHAESCFHRDIAPDNILLVEGDRPVLLDFGAARRVISDMTQTLTVILKPGYAPIEQYAENPSMKQGPWTDIYALGAVVYFALTGAPPDPAVSRIMKDAVRPLAGSGRSRYSEGFLKTLDIALSVRPEDRPQSVAAFWALLDGHLSGRATVSAVTTQPSIDATAARQQSAKPKTKTAIPIIGAVGAVVALGIGTGVLLLRPGPNPPQAEVLPTKTPEVIAPTDQLPPTVVPQPLPSQAIATGLPPAQALEPASLPPPPRTEQRVVSQPATEVNTPKTVTTESRRDTSRTERVNEFLIGAEKAISRGEWRRAEQFADRALALDSGNARAKAIKGRSQAEEKKAAFDAIEIE